MWDQAGRGLRTQRHSGRSATNGNASITNLSQVLLKGDMANASSRKGQLTIVPIRNNRAGGARRRESALMFISGLSPGYLPHHDGPCSLADGSSALIQIKCESDTMPSSCV
jgi:hypothetical protein